MNWIIQLLQALLALFKPKPKVCDSGLDDELTCRVPAHAELPKYDKPPASPAIPIKVENLTETVAQPDIYANLIKEAQRWIGTKEKGGENKGTEVEAFQRASGGTPVGQPWCAAFMCFCMEAVKGDSKPACYESQHVLTFWNHTDARLKHSTPQPGFFIVWNFVGTTSGHMGVVSDVIDTNYAHTVEGNTSNQSAVDREGDGVYPRVRSIKGSAKMKVLGFIDPWGLKSPAAPQKKA